jgi:hypothetical protein
MLYRDNLIEVTSEGIKTASTVLAASAIHGVEITMRSAWQALVYLAPICFSVALYYGSCGYLCSASGAAKETGDQMLAIAAGLGALGVILVMIARRAGPHIYTVVCNVSGQQTAIYETNDRAAADHVRAAIAALIQQGKRT